ncbi:mitochondrial inner membrane protein OXA1L [Ciona intestinalis]
MWTSRALRLCCGNSSANYRYAAFLLQSNARNYTNLSPHSSILSLSNTKQTLLTKTSHPVDVRLRNISLFGSKNETTAVNATKLSNPSETANPNELNFTNYPQGSETNLSENLEASVPGEHVEVVGQSFAELGLGGWDWPHHWIQSMLEFLNVQLGVPWIPAIAIATLTLRLLALPAYIRMRAFIARSHNSQPEQMRLQAAARSATSKLEQQRKTLEYMDFLREKNINPVKALLYQLPIGITFLSFFSAMRGMTQAKVPSLMEGGALWFTDLTIVDPYFLLPTLSCTSLYLLFRFGGAATEVGPMAEVPFMRKVILYSPFVMLPFPGLFKYFGIPKRVVHPKALMDEMSIVMNPMKMMQKIKEERRLAENAKMKIQKHMDEIDRFSKQQKQKKTL